MDKQQKLENITSGDRILHRRYPPFQAVRENSPFWVKKGAKYNLFTLNPSGMEKTFLPDPGYFIHQLILYLCAFCFW